MSYFIGVVFFLFLMVLYNILNANIIGDAFKSVYFEYNNNIVISFIYKAAISFDAIMIVSIVLFLIFELYKKYNWKKIMQILLISLSLVLVFFIWFEYYWGSTFYYGEIQRNVNNMGCIGSTILSIFIVLLFEYKNINRKLKILIYLLIPVFIVFIHLLMYNIFEIKWKMMIY